MEEDKLYCPKCGSTQLVANKKGFGAGKALTGAILTGGIGVCQLNLQEVVKLKLHALAVA